MKKLDGLLLALLLLTIMACGGGGGGGGGSETSISQPSASTEALNSYMSALKAGDTTKALENVSQSAQSRQSQAFQLMDQSSKKKLADAMSTATKEYEDDVKIKYRFTMQLDDGTTVEDTFWLVLENGAWKLIGL